MQINVSVLLLLNTRRQSCSRTLSRTDPGQTRIRTDSLVYTLFRAEGPKTIPYSAARPRIGHIREYLPPPGADTQVYRLSNRHIYMISALLPASHKYTHSQNYQDTSESPEEDVQYFGLSKEAAAGFCCLDFFIKVESTLARDLLAQHTAQVSSELLNDGQENVF